MQPHNAGAKAAIRKLIGYLDNNRDGLGYAKCRRDGLPIGGGGIESANKYISHARLKPSGAWGLLPNGTNTRRSTCAICSGPYERVLQRYIADRQFPVHFRDKRLMSLLRTVDATGESPKVTCRRRIEEGWDEAALG